MELCKPHVEKDYFKHALGVVYACQPHLTLNRAQYHDDTNVRKILRLFGVISLLVSTNHFETCQSDVALP